MAVLARRNGGSLATRDPFSELSNLVQEMDSFMNRVMGSFPFTRPVLWTEAFTPLADIEETDDAYIIEVELPGIKRDDIDVEVQGRRVVVSGERKERERSGILRSKARVTGRFHYEAVLPGDIDADKVEARYEDGVLTVRLPKPEHERTRSIKVQVA